MIKRSSLSIKHISFSSSLYTTILHLSNPGEMGSDSSEKDFSSSAGVVEVTGAYGSEKGAVNTNVSSMLNRRRLKPHQIQLAAIAGSIDASLFVGIGSGLHSAGPLGLIVAFVFWIALVFCVAQCQLETVTLFSVDSSFVLNAGRFVDEAFAAGAGWNFYIIAASYVCFEAIAFNTVLGFWVDLNPAIFITILLVIFFLINIWRVDWFGEIDFWLSCGKVVLALMLFGFTFISIVGL